jgi:Outer membrane protein beta-barrel domain
LKSALIGAALAALTLTAAQAQTQDSRSVRPLLGMGFTFGGDKLYTADFTDGSSDTVRAGGIFTLYGGVEFRATDALAIQATAGYHGDSTRAATNGSIRFGRYPVDVLALYSVTDKVRLGGGVEFVNSPKLSGRGVVGDFNVRFNNTAGVVLEGEYLFTRNFGMKARAASIKFKADGASNKIDGSYGGLLLNYYFF